MTRSTGIGRHPPSRRTHGHSFVSGKATPEYDAWNSMKRRCLSVESQQYKNYGARGILICARWAISFENFLFDMGLKPSPDYSLDRINNDGNYEPSNCRWATRKVQSSNRRTTRIIIYMGERVTVPELSEICGVPLSRLKTRLRRGWTIERAIL